MFVSPAYAQIAGDGGSSLVSLLPLVLIFVVFYFLLIRPQMRQKKEKKNMMNSLKRGDKIVTQGGLIATIVNINQGIIEIKLNEETKVKIQRSAVSDVYVEKPAQGTPPALAGKK